MGDEVAVLIVEDDAIVRAWVRLALDGTEFRIAGEAERVSEALELARRRRPDLLLLDLRLPERSGLDLVRELRAQGVSAPAVLMTATAEPGLNERARETGVQGTVVKSAQQGRLVAVLRAVLAGRSSYDPQHPQRATGRAPLSPREREVLGLVSEGATNAQIAVRLEVSEETVKTLLSRVFLKLGARRRAEAVAVAQRAGLL
ncbi:MAG: response regulator [Gaiellaceae bacterium]